MLSSMKTLLNPDQLRAALKDRVLSVVADRTGLHPSTLYRLANGEQPSLHTVEVLSEYLQRPASSTTKDITNG